MNNRYPIYNYKTNFEPDIKINTITSDDVIELTTYNIQHEWALKVAEAYDEKLFSEIVKLAGEAGYTDVTILDKEFIIDTYNSNKK